MRVFISGLHSGPNPSSGVGVCRSVRACFPEAELVGVDYSSGSSGIHWPEFDRVVLRPAWTDIELDKYAQEIGAELDDGSLWISVLDVEIAWLADALQGRSGVLGPPATALGQVRKPEIGAHTGLGVALPDFVACRRADEELHEFCRRHDWRVWVKGPYYEAVHAETWEEVKKAQNELAGTWGREDLSLQAHVVGHEESVAFCAIDGRLIECVSMEKWGVTEEGKTWTGLVHEVPQELRGSLVDVLGELKWTGGGELEFVRDLEGELWLMEWNPRFPAWVHGATLAGTNMPGRLVEEATGIGGSGMAAESRFFTRVVLEVPTRPGYPPPRPRDAYLHGWQTSGKHPSGMPTLFRQLRERREGNAVEAEGTVEEVEVPRGLIADLRGSDPWGAATPAKVFLPRTAETGFSEAAKWAREAVDGPARCSLAYSVKTDPDVRLTALAERHGFLAETISMAEVSAARHCGFELSRVVLNGPGKWWPARRRADMGFHAVFCDSVEELREAASAWAEGRAMAEVLGVRLRAPQVESRFGIPLADYASFEGLVAALSRLPDECRLGVHFHTQSSSIGTGAWQQLCESMVSWSRTVAECCGRRLALLDVGGGWTPRDWAAQTASGLPELLDMARTELAGLEEIVIEPGKALAESCKALVVSVLEVRGEVWGGRDVVVDGSVAELPMAGFFPHRMLIGKQGGIVDPEIWTAEKG